MKRQYIAPETLITFVEAISDFAHLSGYAIDNGVDGDPSDDNIIPIREENEDDWSEDWPFIEID